MSFRIMLCPSQGCLLNCTFAPCLIPVRDGGSDQEDLRACLLKKSEPLIKWSRTVESGEADVTEKHCRKQACACHSYVPRDGPEPTGPP